MSARSARWRVGISGTTLALLLLLSACAGRTDADAIEVVWTATFDGDVSYASQDADNLYLRSDHALFSIDVESGELQWTFGAISGDVYPLHESVGLVVGDAGELQLYRTIDAATGEETGALFLPDRQVLDVSAQGEALVLWANEEEEEEAAFVYGATVDGLVTGGPWLSEPGCAIKDGAWISEGRVLLVESCEGTAVFRAGSLDSKALSEWHPGVDDGPYDSVIDRVSHFILLTNSDDQVTTALGPDLEVAFSGVAFRDDPASEAGALVMREFDGDRFTIDKDGELRSVVGPWMEQSSLFGSHVGRVSLRRTGGDEISSLLSADAGWSVSVGTDRLLLASGHSPQTRFTLLRPVASEAGHPRNLSIPSDWELSDDPRLTAVVNGRNSDQAELVVADESGKMVATFYVTLAETAAQANEMLASLLVPTDGPNRTLYSPVATGEEWSGVYDRVPIVIAGSCLVVGGTAEPESAQKSLELVAAGLTKVCGR